MKVLIRINNILHTTAYLINQFLNYFGDEICCINCKFKKFVKGFLEV